MSFPMTSYAIWLTTSGTTGLTLPGMMLEPACTGGRLISPKPARGPHDSSRRSLQVLESFTAIRFSTPESCTNAPASWVASTRSSATTSGSPVISAGGGRPARRTGVGVEPGADGRTAQVDLPDEGARLPEPLAVLLDHDGVRGELLAQRHGDGVLELCAAHLQDVGELLRLRGEGVPQDRHGVEQPAGGEVQGDLDGGRVDVVGALAEVDVLQRVQVPVVALAWPSSSRARLATTSLAFMLVDARRRPG